MRVLVSAEETSQTYIANLARHLAARGVEVECRAAGFFEPRSDVDVLHVHWPEALSNWNEPTPFELERVRCALRDWRSLSRALVVTRHNAFPHAHRGPRSQVLYDLVLSAAAGIIHLGAASLSETCGLFACPQIVIPQGNCPDASLVERAAARSALGLAPDGFVVLVFGAIRHIQERELVFETFRRLSVPRKAFVVPRWCEATKPSWSRSPMARFRSHLLDRRARREMRIDDGLVPDAHIGEFFGSADVVFVPRLDALNSALLPMAYSHSRVVVGPRTGNLTEILETTENPTYRAGSPDSAAEAIATASRLDIEALGEANRRYALQNWDWSWIAEQHLAFYTQIVDTPLAV